MVPPPPVLRSWSRELPEPLRGRRSYRGEDLCGRWCLPPLKPICGRCCSSERPGRQKCWERTSEGEKGMGGREAVPASGADRRLSPGCGGASPLLCAGLCPCFTWKWLLTVTDSKGCFCTAFEPASDSYSLSQIDLRTMI